MKKQRLSVLVLTTAVFAYRCSSEGKFLPSFRLCRFCHRHQWLCVNCFRCICRHRRTLQQQNQR